MQRVSTQSSILYLKALFSKNCEIGSSKGFERLLPGPENSFYGPDNIITFAIQGLGAIGTINYVRYKYNTNRYLRYRDFLHDLKIYLILQKKQASL